MFRTFYYRIKGEDPPDKTRNSQSEPGPSALQLPLLRLGAVADHHGDVTLGSDWLGGGEALTHRDLVEPVGLLQRERVGSEPAHVHHHHRHHHHPHPKAPLLRPPRAVTLHQPGGVRGPDLRHVQTQQSGQNQLSVLVVRPLLEYTHLGSRRALSQSQLSSLTHLLRVPEVTRPEHHGAALLADTSLRHQTSARRQVTQLEGETEG